MSNIVELRSGAVAVIVLDNPPVNALKQAVRAGLKDAFTRARDDASIHAIVLTAAGRTFMAGADITEFDKPPQPPGLVEVLDLMDASQKPIVAALFGTPLGGGLEVALACHYRVAPMILSGDPIPAAQALDYGLVDEIVEGDVTEGAIAFARRVRDKFQELRQGDQSKAQRHIFFAEREAAKVPDLPPETKPREIKRVAVIGAGTMGGGISMCFANAGIPVTIVETSREALDRGLATVSKNYKNTVKRGGLKADDMERRVRLMNGTTDIEAVRDADIVIEAVFEEMDLKKQVFAKLDKLAKPTAVLATNTSYLNVNEIAKATERPPSVLGMHFFSPANVMRLLEIVRGAATAPDVLATAIAVGRKIGKVPAVVGVCHGFVGNRMLHTRGIEAERMLLEGALPQDVDGALTEFGFPMGPFAMGDLAGLDVGWRVRKASGAKAEIADALVDAGRYGQKTGRGFYRYEGGSRSPLPIPTSRS